MKDAKVAVLTEWDEHLRTVHPRQWERERRKRARRAAAPGLSPSSQKPHQGQ
jgi:hypothetical protein